MTFFKVLAKDGESCHGEHGKWHLPANNRPGKWMPPVEGDLVACENGYHLCREQDLVKWLNEEIYEAEYRGRKIEANDKVVVRQARLLRKLDTWNERTARHFACDCAEHVLPIFEKQYSEDKRPRQAIEISRRFAEGAATKKELAAAWDAAWYAAGAAAGAAAWDAAWDAAGAAAWDAAGAAAGDAEYKWQTKRLMEYLYPKEAK